MALYLWHASYSVSGTQGLLKDGGTRRRDAVKQMVEKVGGKLHAFYYSFGDSDLVGIAEFPDHVTAAAVSLAVNASGAASLKTSILISPEDLDAATKKSVAYRAPGA